METKYYTVASIDGDYAWLRRTDVKEDGLFYTSISYSKGWKAYVDGVDTEITPVGGAMLAFPLSKGSHTVKLTYTPEGFIPGVILTLIAIVIFVMMILIIPKRRKVFAKAYAKLDARAEAKEKAKAEKTPSKNEE